MLNDRRIAWLVFLLPGFFVEAASMGTAHAQSAPSAMAPVTFTDEQDQQNMMQQLGIRALRPGPSGDERAPNHANYDEAKANPYSNVPDAFTLNNGQKVTTPQLWEKRRAEIIEGFECCVYGRVPKNIPKVTWSVTTVDHEHVGFTPVLAKEVIGHVDNLPYPQISVNIRMILVTPANAKKPVPVLIMFGPAAFPAPNEPNEEQLGRINAATKALLIQQDPSLKEVFEEHPAYQLEKATPFQFPQMNADGDPPNPWELIADGWGFALLDPASIQADNGAGLTRGIIGLINHGQPRKPDDWGALRAWAWGAGRALDYLETDPSVDAKHVGIDGVSRYGKAALVTMAFDPAFRRRARRIVRKRWRHASSPQLRRSRREPHRRRVLLDGWQLHEVRRVRRHLRQQESGRYPSRFQRTDRVVRTASDVHQLRRPGKRRRQVARSTGKLDGDRDGEPRMAAARGKGPHAHAEPARHASDEHQSHGRPTRLAPARWRTHRCPKHEIFPGMGGQSDWTPVGLQRRRGCQLVQTGGISIVSFPFGLYAFRREVR